jgi:hypothetical protein
MAEKTGNLKHPATHMRPRTPSAESLRPVALKLGTTTDSTQAETVTKRHGRICLSSSDSATSDSESGPGQAVGGPGCRAAAHRHAR